MFRSTSGSGYGGALLLNVVGGLLAAMVPPTYRYLVKRYRRQRFKKVFGSAEVYKLVFGSLTLHPQVLQTMRNAGLLSRFFLAKSGNPHLGFSAASIASASDIRAAAYVASGLAAGGGVASVVESDEALKGTLDVDCVSFGALSNLKTLDAFANDSNSLVAWSPEQACFVSKGENKPLYQPRSGYDYGIILRIHPLQFLQRTWIVCAGAGEWGTSGSAWYLAKKWNEIERLVQSQGERFVCVIEVRHEQDESATIINVVKFPTLSVP